MRLTEIGIAGWTAAIGFLIVGSSPPPEFEASARSGGAVEPPIHIGMEHSTETGVAIAVFGNCPDLLAALSNGHERPDSPAPDRAGIETTEIGWQGRRNASGEVSDCAGCLGESRSANAKYGRQACASHDVALLTLQF